MAEAVVDVLEVVHVDHGEREPALQILEPLVVIAAVVDLGDRVHIHLPVAHEQLVEHIFALEHVVALDALDQLERIRPAVHLDERREHIIDIARSRFDLRLWLVRAQHLLRNAVFAAALLFPHRVAVLALLSVQPSSVFVSSTQIVGATSRAMSKMRRYARQCSCRP